mgnify:CR=1 FL=1
MSIIRKILFVPLAIIGYNIAYTLILMLWSIQSVIREFSIRAALRNPSIFEDFIAQILATLAFFSLGFYIAQSKSKGIAIALLIVFGVIALLQALSILYIDEKFRLLGLAAGLFTAYYSFKNRDDLEY